jgi:hypothetical protein
MKKLAMVKSEAKSVSEDMRALYEHFKAGRIERDSADTLANISGKNLKAISIIFAVEVMEHKLLTNTFNLLIEAPQKIETQPAAQEQKE